jgi:acetyl esterase/lipase
MPSQSGSSCTCTATHRELAARISGACGARALVIDYRLAPEHPFPAAVEDAVAAYRWLLEAGHDPARMAIGGDSSGGGLALQALMTLRDAGVALPRAAFFLSPQTDWIRFDGESLRTRARADPMLAPETCRFTASLYVGANDPDTPLLSPVNADLLGLPPCLIHAADRDILLSDATRLAARAGAAGVDVTLEAWDGLWHVFHTSARMVPEARRAIAEVGRFVQERLA